MKNGILLFKGMLLIIIGSLLTYVILVGAYKMFTGNFEIRRKEKVLGEQKELLKPKSNFIPTLIPTPISSPVPTSISISVINEIPISTNYEAICEAKKEEFSGLLKAEWNKFLDKNYSPERSLALYELKKKKDDCLLVCPPKYHLYCLEHNGDMSGFNWQSQCSQCNASNESNGSGYEEGAAKQPRDSHGNICGYGSYCKYECSVIDFWVDDHLRILNNHLQEYLRCKSIKTDCSVWEDAVMKMYNTIYEECKDSPIYNPQNPL